MRSLNPIGIDKFACRGVLDGATALLAGMIRELLALEDIIVQSLSRGSVKLSEHSAEHG
jgi:hypothetical protein